MVLTLLKRHVQLYFRNRMNVFFSLLSPLILFLLYTFFLGSLQLSSLKTALPQTAAQALHSFITTWMFAGIISVTSLTASMIAMSVFIDDRSSGRFKDFLVTPIKRWQMTLGYLLSAFVIALVMSTVVLMFSQVCLAIVGYPVVPLHNLVSSYLTILLLCLTFSSLASFIVTFIGDTTSYTFLNTIVGTAVGFLEGLYINVGTLPHGVVTTMNLLPFAEGATLLRSSFVLQSVNNMTLRSALAKRTIETNYGITAQLSHFALTDDQIRVVLVLLSVVFFALGSFRIGRKIA